MIPTFRRTALASRTMSLPSIVARPPVGPSVVVRIEIVVVFPAPFGPSSTKNSPALTSKEMPSTAFRSAFLYRLTRSSTRITEKAYERAPGRDIGLAVQALEGTVLSERSSDLPVARALRAVLRHGRAQQSLLPPAGAQDVRAVAPVGSRQVRLRREAEPLRHAHQALSDRAGQRRALVRNARGPRAEGGGRAGT